MTKDIINILIIALVIGTIIITALLFALLINWVKEKQKKPKKKMIKQEEKIEEKKKVHKDYTVDSIFKFMQFEKVEDNMIIEKHGKYVMAIECQGINFDLMSEMEKNSVEQGFLQFLNTLRYPVQLYIQTRTINLEKCIMGYKEKVKKIELEYRNMQETYRKMENSDKYSSKETEKYYYELVKQKNLYEYAKDIVYNTEKSNFNQNVLNKKYYVLVSYYKSEMDVTGLKDEEIQNMAFNELYTRAKTIMRSLSSAGVMGKVLDSVGLVDLLYNAYNRDESDILGVGKVMGAGYEDLYTTSPNITERKIKIIDKKINDDAYNIAQEKVAKAIANKEKREKDKQLNDLVKELAESVSDFDEEYSDYDEDVMEEVLGESTKQEPKKEKKGKRGRPKKEKI